MAALPRLVYYQQNSLLLLHHLALNINAYSCSRPFIQLHTDPHESSPFSPAYFSVVVCLFSPKLLPTHYHLHTSTRKSLPKDYVAWRRNSMARTHNLSTPSDQVKKIPRCVPVILSRSDVSTRKPHVGAVTVEIVLGSIAIVIDTFGFICSFLQLHLMYEMRPLKMRGISKERPLSVFSGILLHLEFHRHTTGLVG